MLVASDLGLRERSLEERNEARIDGDLEMPLLAHSASDIGKHVGEHDLVAEALFADHQNALAGERLAAPARRLGVMGDEAAEFVVVADFVFLEAVLQLAHRHQADAARMHRFDALVMVGRERQRGIVGRERFFVAAEMNVGVAEIVPDAGEFRIEPQRLLIEDEAFLDAAIFRRTVASVFHSIG